MLLSVLLSWVYDTTSRSLFAVMLMHATFNWANFLFTGLNTDAGGLAYFLLLASTVAAVVAVFGTSTLIRERQIDRKNQVRGRHLAEDSTCRVAA